MRKIAADKWKHFYVGILMAVFFQVVLQYYMNVEFWLSLGINMLVVNVIGFGFELFSKITGWGHAEINDALATGIGGVVSAFLIIIWEFLIRS